MQLQSFIVSVGISLELQSRSYKVEYKYMIVYYTEIRKKRRLRINIKNTNK